MKLRTYVIEMLCIFISWEASYAQVYSDLAREKPEGSDYPYLLPIWGQKVKEKGFDLPYSAGLSVNDL